MFFKKLLKPDEIPLGLDISDVSLRLVQFKLGRRGIHDVQAFTDTKIPTQAVTNDQLNLQILTNAIKKSVSNPDYGRFTSDHVVAALPETKSFIRVIQVPKMSYEELSEAIHWEAEQYIPMPIGQVYFDWLVLGDRNTPDGEKTEILITASPKDYVDSLTKVLKQSGLFPVALEVESQATARSLVPHEKEDNTYLIVDIDAERTSFIIQKDGVLHFTSSFPVAGNAFTESIARARGVDSKVAEELKRKNGLDPDKDEGEIRKALLPTVNNIVEEIRNTTRFYEEHSDSNSKIDHIVLTGGSAKLLELPSYLSDKLKRSEKSATHKLRSIPGATVQLGNPWVNVLSMGQTPPISRKDSLSFSTAIGLALRTGDSEV